VSLADRPAAWRAHLTRAFAAGLPAIVASTFAVQGLSYIVQLALAPMLGPARFGVVRAAESLAASASLIAAAGMPSLIMRYIPEDRWTGWRRLVVDRITSVAAMTGIAAAVSLVIAAPWLTAPEVVPFVRVLAISVAATAVSRAGIGYFYGASEARRVPYLTVPPAFVAAVCIIGGAFRFGMAGWVGGRVVGDVLLMLIVLRSVMLSAGARSAAEDDQRLRHRALLASGLPLAVSLVARSLLDNSPVLVLAQLRGTADALGVVGLVSLGSAALSVVPAAIVTLALPRMVVLATQDRRALVHFLSRRIRLSVALTLIPALAAALLAEPAAARFLPAYAEHMAVAAWLLLTVPSRVVSSLAGTSLLAVDQVRAALVVTVCSLVVALGLQVAATLHSGLPGLVVATVVAECLSAATFVLVSRRLIAGR
jgi:O-antigen/teichoic acid export membrane protein